MFYHFYKDFTGPSWLDQGIYWVVQSGWAGVDLFFVLSGFLITRNLLEAKGQPRYFRNFYGRRILRIFPLYYASIVFLFFLVPLVLPTWNQGDVAFYRQHQSWFWFHLSNFFSFHFGFHGFLYHFWSLAIEEQFYLLWPAVLFFTSRKNIPRVCLLFCLIGIAFRGAGLYLGYDTQAVHLLLPARFDTLAIGAVLSTMGQREQRLLRQKGSRAVFIVTSVVVLTFLLQQQVPQVIWFRHTIYFTALAIVFAYVILAALDPLKGSLIEAAGQSAFLRKLGKHSYSLYVVHTIVAQSFPIPSSAFLGWFHWPLLAGIAYSLVVGFFCFLLSLLTWELCERPFLALKRYFPINTVQEVAQIHSPTGQSRTASR